MSAARELRSAAERLRTLASGGLDHAEADRCVICALSIRWSDGGLCDDHKYDEQLVPHKHVAAMHPDVALALAKWLDEVAQVWMNAEGVVDWAGDELEFEGSTDSLALPLARLINGGAS